MRGFIYDLLTHYMIAVINVVHYYCALPQSE